jgi:branched-chain amino acid transport system ATP-binding protein
MTLLIADALSKSFGGVAAARDVSLTVAAGELVAVIGPNGAGKSTLFNMIGGQLVPDLGTIRLDSQSIAGIGAQKIWRLGVGRTFQIAQTFLSMSVAENVQMAFVSLYRRSFDFWAPAHRVYADEARALLATVGLAAQADRAVSELAYGDVKRMELAIALASRPKLLLMDEPTAGMAPQERAALMQLTSHIAKADKIGVLFTEHDMGAVFAHADRVLVLVRGEIIASGAPRDVRADPRVRAVYLGESGARIAEQASGRASGRASGGASGGADARPGSSP